MKLEDFDFRIWRKKENKYISKDYPIGFSYDENREIEVYAFFTLWEFLNTRKWFYGD